MGWMKEIDIQKPDFSSQRISRIRTLDRTTGNLLGPPHTVVWVVHCTRVPTEGEQQGCKPSLCLVCQPMYSFSGLSLLRGKGAFVICSKACTAQQQSWRLFISSSSCFEIHEKTDAPGSPLTPGGRARVSSEILDSSLGSPVYLCVFPVL